MVCHPKFRTAASLTQQPWELSLSSESSLSGSKGFFFSLAWESFEYIPSSGSNWKRVGLPAAEAELALLFLVGPRLVIPGDYEITSRKNLGRNLGEGTSKNGKSVYSNLKAMIFTREASCWRWRWFPPLALFPLFLEERHGCGSMGIFQPLCNLVAFGMNMITCNYTIDMSYSCQSASKLFG